MHACLVGKCIPKPAASMNITEHILRNAYLSHEQMHIAQMHIEMTVKHVK